MQSAETDSRSAELEQQPEDSPDQGLPEELQLQLRALCKKFSGREIKDRRWELRRARKARFFWRGVQHILWNDDAQTMVVGQLGNAYTAAGDSATNQPTFTRDFNIYTPYGKSFCATFCGNQPSTRFEPENPRESMDITTAETANKYRRIFEKWNSPKATQLELARLFWTDDRVVAWTRYEENAEKYGTDENDQPRGREIVTLHGVLEHKCPITAKEPAQFPYQKISEDLDTAILKEKFPDISDKIIEGSQGTMDDAFARNARIATAEGNTVLSEGGDALAHLSTIDWFWLRPAAFWTLEDIYRDQFLERFPKGARCAFIGDIYAESKPCSMDDELTVFHATAGDGQNRNGLGDWLISVQEIFNNLMNMTQEYCEYGIAESFFDQAIFDTDALQEQRSQPGARQPVSRKANEPLENSFFTLPSSEAPPFMIQFMEFLQGPFSQFVSSQQAALFGKSDQNNETAKGIELLRNQALGLVGLVWMPFTVGWANVIRQAVKAAATNRKGGQISTMVPVPGKKGQQEEVSVDVEDLKGNILATPETDENFPETWTEKSNKMVQLVEGSEKNPAMAAIMMLPSNQQLFKQAVGLDDLTIPGQASNDKQLAEIEELLLTGPEVSPSAPPEAAMAYELANKQSIQKTQKPLPVPPNLAATTIPIDPNFDDSSAEWNAGKTWVNGEEGRKAKKENPAGFINVQLHLMQHKQQVDAQQAQQLQQQMALKHGTPAPPDPQAQAAKAELLKDASDAITQLDALEHLPVQFTQGNIQGQVAAGKAILDSALKAAVTQ